MENFLRIDKRGVTLIMVTRVILKKGHNEINSQEYVESYKFSFVQDVITKQTLSFQEIDFFSSKNRLLCK